MTAEDKDSATELRVEIMRSLDFARDDKAMR
jgi:hypothetical protein